jgi:hypothetical protein
MLAEELRKLLDEVPFDSEVGVDVGDGFFMSIVGVHAITDENDFYGETHHNAVVLEVED